MFVKGGPNTKDAALFVSTHFGAANAPVTSNALDLGQAANVVPRLEIEVSVDPLPNLAAGQSVTLKLQDSADGATFADLGISFTVNGGAGGSLLIERRFGLASTTRQYLCVVASEPTGGGDLTGAYFRFTPVFFRGI